MHSFVFVNERGKKTAMSPGINGGGSPRNTGTLPKSNRRNDRNREQSAVNQQRANRLTYHGYQQHLNNVVNSSREKTSLLLSLPLFFLFYHRCTYTKIINCKKKHTMHLLLLYMTFFK